MFKPYQNKKKHKVHPHIECVQNEVAALEEELHQLNELEKNGELTAEQTTNKQITAACLERYKATLDKLTDSSMQSKLRSYHDLETREQQQVLFLLQFFYFIRLGQLGLFECIDRTSSSTLKAMTDVCDQLVGAAVYCAIDPKSRKRGQLFSTLKKLEVGSDDEICDKVTFKDLNELMQHIWSNTSEQKEPRQGNYAVLAFDNMVGKNENWYHHQKESPTSPKPDWKKNDKQPEVKESNSEESKSEKSSTTKGTTTSTVEEADTAKELPKKVEESGWGDVKDNVQKVDESGWTEAAKKSVKESIEKVKENTTIEKLEKSTDKLEKSGWDDGQKSTEKVEESGWGKPDTLQDNTGWDVVQNEMKTDTWGSKDGVEEESAAVVEGAELIEEDHKSNASDSTENWRSSRGRGSRGRGRGYKSRGRGRGASRGNGRGRGKGRRDDSSPPNEQQQQQ